MYKEVKGTKVKNAEEMGEPSLRIISSVLFYK